MTLRLSACRRRPSPIGCCLASLGILLAAPGLSAQALGAGRKQARVEQKPPVRPEVARRDVAAKVYSDAYGIYPGLRVDTDAFRRRLERLGYSKESGSPSRRGTYSFSRSDHTFSIRLHEFDYPTRQEPGRLISMQLDEAGRIVSMRSGEGGKEISGFDLEPALLSSSAGNRDPGVYEAALDESPGKAASDSVALRAPSFVDFVARELAGRFPDRVGQGETSRVFTTLDPEMQAIAESVVADNVVEMEHDIGEALAKAGEPLQAAMVVIEPRTGAIRAMVGGRDYGYGGPQFNRAIDMRRQPGSTFKPIVALAALGSEQVGAVHFRPTSLVMDERMQWEWQGQVWSPRNYEGEFNGLVTVREAIEHSLNSAVARLAKDVGVKPIRDLAVRMGMTSDLGVYPSIVLGGQPVPLLDMAKVFSVLATGGMRVTPVSVHNAVDGGGRVVDGNAVELRRIVPATDAYLVTHILEGVMERGTGATARRKGFKHPAAGKTGTSNDYKDAWFVGFTPNLLAAVWVGFDNASSMGLAGSEAALPIWTDFMRQALGDTPHDSFEIPPGIVLADVDKKSGLVARSECPKQVREAFLAAEAPRESCKDHGGEWR